MASGSETSSSASQAQANGASVSSSTSSGSAIVVRTCTTCGRENTTDSRFCRHCGALLPALPAASGPVNNSAPDESVAPATQIPAATAPDSEIVTATNAPDADENLSPAEVEARRARQLLDRSFSLSERGDLTGAILSCRQAVALLPDLAAAHSMLGLLLERSGDTQGAIAAYEETLLLAPDSLLERDSLERLRAQNSTNDRASKLFHFDDSELFPENASPTTNAGARSAAIATGAATVVATTPVGANAANASAATASATTANSVVHPTSPAQFGAQLADAGVSPAERSVTGSTNNSALSGVSSATPAVAPIAASSIATPPVAPIDFGDEPNVPRPGELWWQTARNRPSFYVRALPLTGVALAGLLFMLWARNVADNRRVAAAGYDTTVVETTNQTVQPASNGAATTGAATNSTTPAAPNGVTGSGVPITNDWSTVAPNAPAADGTASPAAPPAPSAPGAVTQPARTTPAGSTPARSTPARPAQPRIASPNIPPARLRPATGSGGGTNEPFAGIPPARVLNSPAAPTPVQAVPSGENSAMTRGGAPLNPAGSSRRGSIRVISRPSPAQAPPRPENTARGAEESAANTSSDFDRAYRLQQRALTRLDAGDNAGAISDFQAAISAYNDQLARGVRVNESRRGISSCQSGLRLAQANSRR